MKSILLIGLGRFGKHVAMKLHSLGHQIMAVDDDEERVNEILPYVTNAIIGDSTSETFLSSLGVSNFDVCIVAIGSNLAASVLVTMNMKELGVPYIVCKAHDETHRQVLLKLGADQVVIPEQEGKDEW